jgi:hypothetical protein
MESKDSNMDQMSEMLTDLVLRQTALERIIIKKGICTKEEMQKEINDIGAELAGLVHTAIISQVSE